MTIGTRGDEIDFDIEVKFQSQKSQECETPIERADQNWISILIVALDLLRQFDDALLEPLLTNQYFQSGVDIRTCDVALPPILVPSSSVQRF